MLTHFDLSTYIYSNLLNSKNVPWQFTAAIANFRDKILPRLLRPNFEGWPYVLPYSTCPVLSFSRALRASSFTCSRASRASCSMCSCVSRALCPTCSRASRASYRTCSTVNHYEKQLPLKVCDYIGSFHK